MLVLEGLVGPTELFIFSFFSITGRGIDLDYRNIEWFALEMNRDHSVCYAQSPSPQNWENKMSTAMQKHEGVLFLARARAPATSNAVEWSKEPRAQMYSSIYRF